MLLTSTATFKAVLFGLTALCIAHIRHRTVKAPDSGGVLYTRITPWGLHHPNSRGSGGRAVCGGFAGDNLHLTLHTFRAPHLLNCCSFVCRTDDGTVISTIEGAVY